MRLGLKSDKSDPEHQITMLLCESYTTHAPLRTRMMLSRYQNLSKCEVRPARPRARSPWLSSSLHIQRYKTFERGPRLRLFYSYELAGSGPLEFSGLGYL